MGFTERGKQCLLPEEAVYLLECGSIQIFHKDMPLSVQEVYERLLLHQTLRVLQYQVYSHLKRLGFIVTRFNSSSSQSAYERRLNIRSSIGSAGKRKRSPSLRSEPGLSRGRDGDVCGDERSSEDKSVTSCTEAKESNREGRTFRDMSDRPGKCPDHDLKIKLSDQPTISDHNGDSRKENPPESTDPSEDVTMENLPGAFRWDFSKISFPDCAPDRPCNVFPAPQPALLPENVAGREVDISPWRQRLSLKPEKMSRKERDRYDWERRFKSNVRADAAVQRCGNWTEYKKLLRGREESSRKARPPHLWASAITPLVTPEHGKTTASVLDQITVMTSSQLLDGSERLLDVTADVPQIHFDVYQADGTSDFRKSRPGLPYARVCVRSFSEAVPSLRSLKCLALRSVDVPVVFALVDCGEVAFYSFKDFRLPVDVYP
uniref:tRNA-splicing endonuclease subunit Sen54 N-terminal domain-containing protein n=1 Tax=Leptobrachium leishanense TaxID=445787 RepID=A0A8C5QNA1_9ANUR